MLKNSEALSALNFSTGELDLVGAPVELSCQALSFMEVKNYLIDGHNKQSGWEALNQSLRDGLRGSDSATLKLFP